MEAYGVQSSELSRLYTNVLKSKPETNYEIESLRMRFLLDKGTIEGNTLALGARSTVSHSRSIAQIAKYGVSDLKTSHIITSLIEHFNCSNVLELGASFGINTLYMSTASCVEQICTIEGDPAIAALAKDNFLKATSGDKVELKVGNVDEVLEELNAPYDLIFIDANHTYEATLRYFAWAKVNITHRGLIILDDIHWSKEMTQAWHEIRVESSFTSIENYNLGILLHEYVGDRKLPYILDF